MSEAVVVGGVRTPVARYGGALVGIRPDVLAALAVGEALARSGARATAIDEVILGAANQAGEDNRNVARMAVLLAGLPDDIPGLTVNRLCGTRSVPCSRRSRSRRVRPTSTAKCAGTPHPQRARRDRRPTYDVLTLVAEELAEVIA